MQNETKAPTIRHYFIIAVTTVLACLTLFSLDKDMHSFSDFLEPVNINALVIYFTPTFFISSILFRYIFKMQERKKALVLSLLTGIPLSFFLVIFFFVLMS